MTKTGYLFLGLNAIVAALVGVLAYAVTKIFVSARNATKDLRKDGAETAFMAAAMEDALKKIKSRERAMKERAEASERLSSEIIASMTSGLLVVGQEGSVRTLNPAARKLLGFPDADYTGYFRDVLGSARPVADVIDECLHTGRPIVRRSVTMDGPRGATHLGITVSPIHDPEGLHGAICLFTDLSEVVELEEQLRLKDSLARVGELTAGIAHEFRNGLATIHGYARLLELERLPDDYRPYVQGIRDETEALGQIVTNFLNFAKPAELTVTPVEMRAIAERAADEYRQEARARGGDISVSGDFSTVEGDDVLLRQAFSNLCRNALEAALGAKVAPRISIHGAVDLAHATQHIVVEDNGAGVDPKDAERLFRPFFTTKPGGIGLGLALVQKIIVSHNGRVSVGRGDAGGARMTVILPAVAS